MIELRTLLAVLLVADLLLAILLWVGAGRRVRDDLALWSFSLVTQALAFGFFAVRGEPQGAAMVLGAMLLGLSLTLQAAALVAFDRRHLPTWVHTAVMAAIAAPFALIIGDVPSATLFGGVVFGTLLLVCAGISWQIHAPSSASARAALVLGFSLAALAFYIRGVNAMIYADAMRAFTAPTLFESGLYLAGFAAVLGTTFGFLLLNRGRADATMQSQVAIDSLTGAYTRGVFQEIAEREFSRARRAGQPLSLLLLDIDGQAERIESRGARFGDEVLKRLADIVKAALRKEDVLVRFGPARFLVILPSVPGPGAVVVAGRIRREVEAEAFEHEAERVPVTVSVGVAARLDEGPESIDSLLGRADQALQLAQRRGRNRVVALSLGRSLAA
jgi:diguanylate cyclase (GGDEF)-like protein